MTALHIAASEGHSEIVNVLLQFDANPDIVDKVVCSSCLFVRFLNTTISL